MGDAQADFYISSEGRKMDSMLVLDQQIITTILINQQKKTNQVLCAPGVNYYYQFTVLETEAKGRGCSVAINIDWHPSSIPLLWKGLHTQINLIYFLPFFPTINVVWLANNCTRNLKEKRQQFIITLIKPLHLQIALN